MKCFCILLCMFLAAPLICEDQITGVSHIDWKAGTITIDAVYKFQKAFTPSLRLSAERELEKAYPALLKEHLLEIPVDSNTRIIDVIAQDRQTLNRIDNLFNASMRLQSVLTDDFSHMKDSYILNMYPDLADIFINHTIPNVIRPVLEPVTRANFTGILIYAKGTYQVYGEQDTGSLVPCLFPKIRDQRGRVILDKQRLDPDVIKKSGLLYYTDSTDDPMLENRIGTVPMRIHMNEIFGVYRTDIVLSENDTYLILSSKYTVDLLKRGRVAVVLDLPN